MCKPCYISFLTLLFAQFKTLRTLSSRLVASKLTKDVYAGSDLPTACNDNSSDMEDVFPASIPLCSIIDATCYAAGAHQPYGRPATPPHDALHHCPPPHFVAESDCDSQHASTSSPAWADDWDGLPHAAGAAAFDPFEAESSPAAAGAQGTGSAGHFPACRQESGCTAGPAAGWRPSARDPGDLLRAAGEQKSHPPPRTEQPSPAATPPSAAGRRRGPMALPPPPSQCAHAALPWEPRSVMLSPADPFHDDWAFW